MIVKKFQAETETEAILKAKDELGSGAVVLNVKTLKQRGVFRLFKKDVVEVTAALEEKEFINGINNKRPTMENKGANSGFISSQPMKNITGGSQINLVADENLFRQRLGKQGFCQTNFGYSLRQRPLPTGQVCSRQISGI